MRRLPCQLARLTAAEVERSQVKRKKLLKAIDQTRAATLDQHDRH